MTTVAWDGRTLAADRRVTGGSAIAAVTKLRAYPDGRVAGVAGCIVRGRLFLDWLGDPQRAEAPDWQDHVDEHVIALEIFPNGAIRRHGRHGWHPIAGRLAAIGSGAGFALGAMAAGKSAAGAIRIAGRFDEFTGNGVTCLQPGKRA